MIGRPAAALMLRADTRLKGGTRRGRIAGIVAVVVLLMVTSTATRFNGGALSPFNHLGYLPILMAAYLFGLRGGLITALVVCSFLGPVPWRLVTGTQDENFSSGLVRAAVYVGVGTLTGYLFEHARLAITGWRTAAITVARRERDAMVALARGAEAKDSDTGDHVLRCQLVAERIALASGMDRALADDIGWAAMLHDVGKLHVPDRILLKPGPLTPEEWQVMRMHPVWGEHILEHGDGFEMARRIARWHHEDFNGSGYPDGLRGTAIPFEARIVRIADSFDAITHDRPYRRARDVSWALQELERQSGLMFDPELVRLFTDLLRSDPSLAEQLVRPSPGKPPIWSSTLSDEASGRSPAVRLS